MSIKNNPILKFFKEIIFTFRERYIKPLTTKLYTKYPWLLWVTIDNILNLGLFLIVLVHLYIYFFLIK